MKKLISSIIIILLVGMIVVTTIKAAQEATVTATVTIQNISVTVSDGTVAYGTMPINSWKSTLPGELNDMQTATNNGNVTENFNIKGQDSASWTLASTQGENQYVHQFCNDTDYDCTNPPTNYTPLTSTSYQTLKENIPVNGTVDFQLRIGTPTATTDYTEQRVDVTVQAVASQ